MKFHHGAAVMAALLLPALGASAADKADHAKTATASDAVATSGPSAVDDGLIFHPQSSETAGSVTVGGRKIDYRAVAGTLVIHPKGWDDVASLEEKAKGDAKDKAAGDTLGQGVGSVWYVLDATGTPKKA